MVPLQGWNETAVVFLRQQQKPLDKSRIRRLGHHYYRSGRGVGRGGVAAMRESLLETTILYQEPN